MTVATSEVSPVNGCRPDPDRKRRQTALDEACNQMIDGLELTEQNLARCRVLGALEGAISIGVPVDVEFYVTACSRARAAELRCRPTS